MKQMDIAWEYVGIGWTMGYLPGVIVSKIIKLNPMGPGNFRAISYCTRNGPQSRLFDSLEDGKSWCESIYWCEPITDLPV